MGGKIKKLPTPIKPAGYDGKEGASIKKYVQSKLILEGREFSSEPLLIAQLGQHDCIVGVKWLQKRGAILDCSNLTLAWKHEVKSDGGIKSAVNRMQSVPGWTIATIGEAPFRRQVAKGKLEVCVVTLASLDKAIDRLKTTEDEEEENKIKEHLPHYLHDLADVFSKRKSDCLPPSRPGEDCSLQLQGDPVKTVGHAPLYRMSREELEAAREYILENLNKGFIVPSKAPFASPILLARKKDGGLRLCVDYRKLNSILQKDQYPLPLIDELLERVAGAKVFTKLDLRQGFHRIPMNPDSEDLTTFRTRHGSYKYRVMPFGLSVGPAHFQRLMNRIFADLLDVCVTIFVDDLLIYSKNEDEHQEHVRTVLQRLRAESLQASLPKCEFGVTETKYLGFLVSTTGVAVDPDKIAAIQAWQPPTTVKGVQSFLGFANFYRRFIQGFGKIAAPLNRLVRKDVAWQWAAEQQEAFDLLKHALCHAPVLRHYDPELPARIETDASDGVVAGVLSQLHAKDWHPVAFFSRTMTPAERNYPVRDKELLAIFAALKNWRAEVTGLVHTPFEVFTDHQSLQYFQNAHELSPRHARWAEFFSQFVFKIVYRPGKANVLADALTRNDPKALTPHRPVGVLLPASDDTTPTKEEVTLSLAPLLTPPASPLMQEVLRANRESPSLTMLHGDPQFVVEDGVLLRNRLLVVPKDDPRLITKILDQLHRPASSAHPGQKKMLALVSGLFWWSSWRADTIRYVQNCSICQRAKTPRDKTPGLLHPLPIPTGPFQHIHVDLKEYPKDRHGYDAVLVFVDRFSKTTISVPCHRTLNAQELSQLFVTHVYRHYGAPESITSDRGPQFIAQMWTHFCTSLGIQLTLTSGHHPQTNGQVEKVLQHLDNRLRPYVNQHQDNWSEMLPFMDHAANSLPQESTGFSPFELLLGRPARSPCDWEAIPDRTTAEHIDHLIQQREAAQVRLVKAQQQQAEQADRHRRPAQFSVGDYVWLSLRPYSIDSPSRKLAMQREGPFQITECVGHSYRLALPDSYHIHPIIPADRLRLAARDPLPGQRVDASSPLTVETADPRYIAGITAVRLYRGRLEYQVRWCGTDHDPRWHPAASLRVAPHRLRDFHLHNPDLPGPPRRLPEWIAAWEAGEVLPEDSQDGLPQANR